MTGSSGANTADWVGAIGSIAAAFAAIVLLVLAYRQMKAGAAQAAAAGEQVTVMRDQAERADQQRRQEASERAEVQDARDRAVRKQIAAVAGITEATRDAVRAQLQPLVFAFGLQTVRGPNAELDLAAGQVAFTYRLANEGTGIALNVRHGVEIADQDHEFGGGLETRVLRPGDTMPPWDPTSGRLLHIRPLMVVVPEQFLPSGWEAGFEAYWARCENVFGDVFETRNPDDPRQSAAFMKITDITPD